MQLFFRDLISYREFYISKERTDVTEWSERSFAAGE